MGKAIAVLALGLGLVVTAAVWTTETQRLAARRDALILERTGALAAQIRQRLVAYEIALRGGASLFAATDNPSRGQWRAYVSALALDSDYPGIQGVAFAVRLAPEQVGALERSVRDEGFADFKVWPAADRQAESAIVYIEPLDAINLRALGYDMSSNAVRREAMQASRDSGKAVLTGPVTLVQDAGDAPRAAVLLYVPLYRHGAPIDSTQSRSRALLGWVYAPFRPGDLMASLDRGAEAILAVRLLDAAPDGTDRLLFADASEHFAHTTGMTPVRVPIEFAGRRWQLEAFPSAGAASVLERRRPWEYLAGGVLISLLLFGVVWSMATTRDRAHALALSMTQALRRANEALDQRVAERTAELVAANERLRALAEAGVVIGGLPDSGARLDHLAEQARRLVDCDCAVLVPGAPGGGAPSLKVARPLTQARRAELVAAAEKWPRPELPGLVLLPWSDGPGPGPGGGPEVLAVPIRVANDAPRGYLYLAHEAGRHFSPEDLAIVRQLMLLAAAAVATAEAAEEERRARLEAEAANRSKDRFLAIVSHELRTPLHAILGWLGVVERRGDRGESLQRALAVIRRNAESQNLLIDDLLDLARVEQGKLQIDREPVDLGEIVDVVCESQRQVARDRRVTLEASAPRGSFVLGDSLRLQQVVGNLLGNALKFTPAAGRIAVSLRREGARQVIEVTDDGQGIEPAMLGRLFEPFRQGDTTSRRRYGGLGLGLALVRHIVELHGGQVSAHSEGEGHGASFTVSLPRLDGSVPRPSAVLPLAAFDGPAPERKLMIVDDHADAREAVAGLLQDEGCTVIEFDSVDAALAWLAARPKTEWPAIVLCDIEMPGRDGYEFLDDLRALEAQRGDAGEPLPVVAITAHAGAADRSRIASRGFVDLVPKPVRLERLLRLIGEAPGRRPAS
ncbi:response regulator [Zeimonas arvi]|uniref:histidine kinase n=2 Tax=Zeimonas arvi TaxID=2498847 RepID=A0A5C8NT46_9BURK|nr:response regulator [Zeimonas arvi]